MNSQIINKNNYKLYLYKTDKFKSIQMNIVFKKKTTDDLYLYSALCQLLLITNKKYKNKIDRFIKEEDLYNASLELAPEQYGDANCFIASMSFINPKLVHDDFIEEAIKMPFDILSNPSFDESYLKELKDKMKFIYRRQMESPANRAGRISRNLFFSNPLYRSEYFVEDEIVDTITMEQLETVYNDLINNSNIDIYLLGDVDDSYIEYIDKYNTFKSNNLSLDFMVCNDTVDKVKEQTDIKEDINQAQVYMYYNLPELDKISISKIIIFNIILGGGMNSRLFKDVRTKNQLCYTVNSRTSYLYSFFRIYTGVDKENVDKAISVIKEVVSTMNNITDQEFEDAKVKELTSLDYVYDSLDSIFDRLFMESNDLLCDIEEQKEIINSLTKKDIEEVFNTIKLNTVYVLKGE